MPTPDGKLSLVEFAAAKKPKSTCRVCELPELAEIHEARQLGISFKNIAGWLVEVRGYDADFISHHRVERHFGEKHNA